MDDEIVDFLFPELREKVGKNLGGKILVVRNESQFLGPLYQRENATELYLGILNSPVIELRRNTGEVIFPTDNYVRRNIKSADWNLFNGKLSFPIRWLMDANYSLSLNCVLFGDDAEMFFSRNFFDYGASFSPDKLYRGALKMLGRPDLISADFQKN